jgi:hypothetical protein
VCGKLPNLNIFAPFGRLAETENPTQKYNRECRIPNIEKYLTAETGNPTQK